MSDNINFDYKNLSPFKWFVLENFPFIEADFDALTEWQLFCKIGKEINKIIDSQNIVGEQAENLTNSFNTLYNYVHNYFDNLDVQEEINNKLNEMVTDGTLEALLTNYTKVQKIYNTTIDLINDNNVINNQKIKTMGYYEINDGGGAEFIIKNVIDNTNFQIELNNGLYATLIYNNNEINIKQFGAKVDGITDDYISIQNAINQLNNKALSNYTLIIPGITVITEKINFNTSGTTLKGYNINKCGIKLKGENTFIEFGNDETTTHEIQVRDMFIRGDFTQSQLLQFNKCFNIYLNRVYLNETSANNYLIKFINGCGIVYIKECILDSSENVALYPGIANGIYFYKMDSIFDMQGCNCWNLNKLLHFENTTLQVNIHDNWIECCKQLFYNQNATDLRYMNLNIENNTFNLHSYSAFTPGTTNMIEINGTNETNAYNSYIKLINNNIYMWDVTLKNNTLINIPLIKPDGTLYIVYDGNTLSGKTLNDLQSYICFINDTLKNTIKFANVYVNSRLDAKWLTNIDKSIICGMRNETSSPSYCYPNGVYLHKNDILNDGNIVYDKTINQFLAGYNGEQLLLPKRYIKETIPYPVTQNNIVEVVNAICRVINNSNVGKIQS